MLDPQLSDENYKKNFLRFIAYFGCSICSLNTLQIPPKNSKYFMQYGTLNYIHSFYNQNFQKVFYLDNFIE